MNGKILIIEGKKEVSRDLKFSLRHDGYSILTAMDGESGIKLFNKTVPDLVIVDITLLKKTGLEVCKLIRDVSKVPIVMLGEKKRENDCVLGLELGADDYMAKPLNIRELQARVHAIMRRSNDSRSSGPGPNKDRSAVSIGGISVNFEAYEVLCDGAPVALTAREYDLLCVLVKSTEKVFSREQLLDLIWGSEKGVDLDVRTVDQLVARLRKKLGKEGVRIITVKSRGYRFKA